MTTRERRPFDPVLCGLVALVVLLAGYLLFLLRTTGPRPTVPAPPVERGTAR